MFRVLLPIIAGISIGEWCGQPQNVWVIGIVAAVSFVVAVVSYVVSNRRERTWVDSLTFFLALSMFFVDVGLILHRSAQPSTTLSQGHHSVTLQLCDNPQPTAHSLRAEARLLQDYDGQTIDGRVMLYFDPRDPMASTLSAGDNLMVMARFHQPRDTNLSPTFNYATYLRRHGIAMTAYVAEGAYSIVAQRPTTLRHLSARAQQSLARHISSSHLSSEHQTVAAAMLLGLRDARLADVRQQYNQAGIVHLLCVSGLHVGLIAALATSLLRWMGNRRWERIVKMLLQLAVVWLYAFVTGFGPATVRASVMFSLLMAERSRSQKADSLNALCVAALLTIFFQPMVVFDIGFQYSYAAMLGLILFAPLLSLPRQHRHRSYSLRRRKSNQPNKISLIASSVLSDLYSLAVVSFSAQLLVLPLTLFYFGQFPPYFLLANVLIIPFASLLLSVALLLMAFSFWQAAAGVVASILDFLLSVVDALVLRIGSLPGALVTVENFSLWQMLLAYVGIAAFYCLLRSWRSPAVVSRHATARKPQRRRQQR